MSILDYKASREEWLERLKRESYNTWRTYKVCIKKWDDFLESIKHNDVETLAELKAHQTESETYLFLNRYITYLTKQKIKRSSIDLCFAALRSWCAANGVMLFNEYIHRFVNLPKPRKETRVSLTHEQISKLIHNSPRGVKAVLLVLLSSGMRISEVLQLRVKDVDFNSDPVRINIRADTTKTKEQRTAFMSAEAKKIVEPLATGKDGTDLIFVREMTPNTLISFEIRFAKVRKECGLIDKYDDERNHHVNIHSFRAYFHTQATKHLNGDLAHALIGHRKYLDQYLRLDDAERTAMYKKLEPYVSVSREAIQKGIIEERERELMEISKMKDELEKQKAKIKHLEKLKQ